MRPTTFDEFIRSAVNSHCLSHEHMHQTCCFVNSKTQLTQSLEKNPERLPNIYNWTCTEIAVPLPSFHWLKAFCVCSFLRAVHSTYVRPSQQPNPALLHWVEVPRSLDSSISEIISSEEKALSEVAEPQHSQSCFCKLQHVPAMSNNSRYVYRKDTFRLISWEISLNTFSLLHHAEEHQSSREIYYILLEK